MTATIPAMGLQFRGKQNLTSIRPAERAEMVTLRVRR